MKLNSDISAVITGGASGLGAATARLLASHGVKVAIFDMNEAVGQALASELGGVYCNVDVMSEEQVDAAFTKARAAIGQERILVNCAGTADAVKTVSRDKKTGEIRPCAADRFNRIIQINLVGTFRCIAKSAAGMLTLAPLADGDRGAIVNTASVAGITAGLTCAPAVPQVDAAAIPSATARVWIFFIGWQLSNWDLREDHLPMNRTASATHDRKNNSGTITLSPNFTTG